MIKHVNIYVTFLMLLLNAPLAYQQTGNQGVYYYFEITNDLSSKSIQINPRIPEGLNYRIQMSSSRDLVPLEYFKGITPIYIVTNERSSLKIYYAGMFRKIADARDALEKVKEKGFNDSFIICFLGDAVSSRAAELEREWGTKPFERVFFSNTSSVLNKPRLPETNAGVEIEIETEVETETETEAETEIEVEAETEAEAKTETGGRRYLAFDLNNPSFFVKSLIIVVIISIVFQFVSLVWILINRNKMRKVQRKTDKLMIQYQTLLVDYLFLEDNEDKFREIKRIATSEFNKKILIDQMIDLSINLSGEAKEKLRNLYFKLRLDQDSIAKANSRKWHIKIKGFKELAFMNIRDANKKIEKALKSKNDILRMEAQLALVRLNEDDPFKFLDNLKKPFTLWEQLNVHELITYHNLPIPDFSRWTNSPNKTVVIFALRMINVFKQTRSVQAVIDCLNHPNYEIRHTAIKVCGEIHLRETLPHLKQMYKNEDYLNCLAIVQAMGKMPDESMLGFLKLVIDKEEDVQLQIEAALAINKMGNVGMEALEKLMESEYKNYQIIIRHILDKRIS